MTTPFIRTLLALVALAGSAAADTVTLAPIADNTLYQYPAGNVSNGKGWYIFAGLTNNNALRRALLEFDVAAVVPAGATITSVELRLFMSKTMIGTAFPTSLHRVLVAWGEGASDATGEEGEGAFAEPGDATWLNTFYPGAFWAAAGGDFVASPSATTAVGPVGPCVWSSTPALVADVQTWLDAPQDNHGWLLHGVEVSPTNTTKRFDSRENPDPATRPALVIEFTPPVTCAGAWSGLGAGLAGAGGLVPTLAGTGCPQIGGAIALELADGLGAAPGGIFVGLAPATTPFKGGTFLVGSLVLQVDLVLGGQAGMPGLGSLSLPGALPDDAVLVGTSLWLQAAFADAAAVKGVSLTPGLEMAIG